MRIKEIKIVPMGNLPIHKIGDKEWRSSIQIAESRLQPGAIVSILPMFPPTGEAQCQALTDGRWGLALHWVLKKKWLPKHKIPVPRQNSKLIEPLGAWLRSILELCIQCHAMPASDEIEYKNASEWFALIFFELHLEDSRTHTNFVGKDEEAIADRAKVKAIRDNQNPYPENSHMWKLMNRALLLAKHNPAFDRAYLRGSRTAKPNENQGFIKTYTAWIGRQESPEFKAYWASEGVLMIQEGKGRSVAKAVLSPKEQYLGNSEF